MRDPGEACQESRSGRDVRAPSCYDLIVDEPRGRYSRGYMPHIDLGAHPQFVTWHLADAMPMELLRAWRNELGNNPEEARKGEIYRLIEKHVDEGYGSQALRDPRVGRIVQESLAFNHRRLYHLHSWAVMPTHVHVLLTPLPDKPLGEVVRTVKSYTAKEANRILGRTGRFWQEDYFDRWIRNEEHFQRVLAYIEWNPVKAKLCQDPTLWPWSSANEAARSRIE